MENSALDLKPLDEVLDELADQYGSMISILQRTQEIYG